MRAAAPTAPRRTTLDARVVTADQVVSPMSGMSGALVRWAFRSWSAPSSVYVRPSRLLCTGVLAAGLHVETELGRIDVGCDRIELDMLGATDVGEPVGTAIPPIFRDVIAALRTPAGEILYYHETLLRHGDLLTLDAILDASGGAGPYRTSSAPTLWRTRPDLGPIRLCDRRPLGPTRLRRA